MDINIYTKGLSVDLLPKIKKRFADFNMDIEFHPDFKFDEQTDTGFLSLKLKVHNGHSKHYDDFGSDVLTGFELLFSDFDYGQELKNSQPQKTTTEKKSFISKLFGTNNSATQQQTFIADQQLDKLLKLCNKDLMLSWIARDKSELRISLFFAAILADLTDGVVFDPQNGRYLSGQQALKTFPLEVADYEQSFTTDKFTLDKFVEWRWQKEKHMQVTLYLRQAGLTRNPTFSYL